MRRIGKKPGEIYNPAEAEIIKADRPRRYRIIPSEDFALSDNGDSFLMEVTPEEEYSLRCYPVDMAIAKCRDAAASLSDLLKQICLDPKIELASPETRLTVWWFDDLIGALHLYQKNYSDSAQQRLAETTISKRVFDDLDFAAHVKGLVLIEGEQRTGKSTAAETWCAMHPGQAIYISLESGKDIFTFFRSIARAIGTASSGQMKANEMRMRIEDMLQERHLTVVIDEAHYLFLWLPGQRVPRIALIGCARRLSIMGWQLL